MSQPASTVMSLVIEKAIEISRGKKLSAGQLNRGGFQACLDEAFEQVDHAPFATRDELNQAHTAEADAAAARIKAAIAARRAARTSTP